LSRIHKALGSTSNTKERRGEHRRGKEGRGRNEREREGK
jgi:hypothetical protein